MQSSGHRPILKETGIDPVYETEWKTRYVWSPTELAAIERNQAMVLDLMEQTPLDARALVNEGGARDRRATPRWAIAQAGRSTRS